jgi:alpha-beta hydrolase superfamily lysophospholipase
MTVNCRQLKLICLHCFSAEKEYRYKGRFLYGESMGGAVALLLHKKEPSFYNGAVLAAPMCKVNSVLANRIFYFR